MKLVYCWSVWGQRWVLGDSVPELDRCWKAAAADSANSAFTCTPARVQSSEKPRRTRAYREQDINHPRSRPGIQSADMGPAFGLGAAGGGMEGSLM